MSDVQNTNLLLMQCNRSRFSRFRRFAVCTFPLTFVCELYSFFIACRYCYGKSVRPSVCHTLVLYLNECIHRQTLSTIWQGNYPSFVPALPLLQNSNGNSLSGSEKNCDFRPKSPFISETVRDRLLWITNWKS